MALYSESALAALVDTCRSVQSELAPQDDELDFAVHNSAQNGLEVIAIGPAQGQFLSMLCRMVQAKAILEIGVLGGYSTIWLARSVPGVQVTGVEFDPHHVKVAKENLRRLDNVEIRQGAALDILPRLKEEQKTYDFVFIDADWANQGQYLDWAVKLGRPGTVIFVDNALRQISEGEVAGMSNSMDLIEHAKKHKDVTITFIPTVNSDKLDPYNPIDGFLLGIVN